MISYLKGTITDLSPSSVILDVNNVGYCIRLAYSLEQHMQQGQKECLLYTSLIVRETSHTLYGFLKKQERDLFELLLQAQGVGPKLACSILGHLPYKDLIYTLLTQDSKALCAIPGLGKKTAQKLVFEMMDRLKNLPPYFDVSSMQTSRLSQNALDATSALIHLGYSPKSAEKAVQKAQEEQSQSETLETLITKALATI